MILPEKDRAVFEDIVKRLGRNWQSYETAIQSQSYLADREYDEYEPHSKEVVRKKYSEMKSDVERLAIMFNLI